MLAPPFHVLVVCTANISRSAFAHGLAQSLIGDKQVTVASAGTHARVGHRMDPLMVAELERRGVPDPGYRSRLLTSPMLEAADVVLTMTTEHRSWILEDSPQHFGKVFTLGQFASTLERVDPAVRGRELVAAARRNRGPALETADVVDPYGRGERPTAEAARQIEDLLRVVIPRLTMEESPGTPPATPEPDVTPPAATRSEEP